MKNHFLSRFDAYNLRKAIIYFVIALLLFIISLVLGLDDLSLAAFMFPCGIAFFFYALLRPWGNAKYFGIMVIIILLALFLGVGIGILTKWQLTSVGLKTLASILN
jgi:uncharacterized membrane protein YtjA (UPF0391 family)